jgi:hypothetical protein
VMNFFRIKKKQERTNEMGVHAGYFFLVLTLCGNFRKPCSTALSI